MNTPILTPSRVLTVALLGASLFALAFSAYIFETNEAGYVQVKQESGTGKMTVRTEPGMYPQMFANITEYKISEAYDFNEDRINVTNAWS